MNEPVNMNSPDAAVPPADDAEWSEVAPPYSEAKRMISVFFSRPLPVVGLVFIVLLILIAVFAPLVAPYDPYKMDILHKLQSPSMAHWLGTDSLGRDTLSRIIFGSRTSLISAM